MAKVPPLTQEQQDTAVLQQIKNADKSRKYSDEQIAAFPEEIRATLAQAARKEIIKKSLRRQSNAAKKKLESATLSAEDRALYQEQILTTAEIEEEANKIVPPAGSEEPPKEPDVKPEDFKTTEGEPATPLPDEASVPSIEVSVKQREARNPPPEVAEDLKKQIEKPKLPQLTPIGGLTEMDLFIEPVLRQCYTLIAAKPTGGFYLGMHIPCGYPIILPVFYPVTLVGKAPAGAIAMKFLGSNPPYCGGSQPFDVSILANLGIPSVDTEQSPVEPCNPNLEFEQLAECVKAFNEQARNELGPMEVPESLRAIMALIAAQQAQPAPAPVVPTSPVTPQEQIDIFVKDGLDQFDFELTIIE